MFPVTLIFRWWEMKHIIPDTMVTGGREHSRPAPYTKV